VTRGPRRGGTGGEIRGNVDPATVVGFGREWTAFDQSALSAEELEGRFRQYFRLFPWSELPSGPIGFDLGCGSGRWARYVAPRVKTLHCIDASAEAIDVAKRTLVDDANCDFHVASVDEIPLPPNSMDFGYSLGVLHHVPDTQAGIRACAKLLRPGAPLLLYLYYALDQRPPWFRAIWRAVNATRLLISRLPHRSKLWITSAIAALVYFPLARLARFLGHLGVEVDAIPLSTYRDSSFYTMRTDAFDRFGTKLEKRFSAPEIRAMMESAGLERVAFSAEPPYWCAIGYKRVSNAT
jgi:SAM-dependent methyltransferase